VALWQRTGERPAVAVWTAEQLAEFLEFVREDHLFALWWVMAVRGLRRGEAAGLRWADLDLDRRELTVTQQRVQIGRQVIVGPPKSAASRRTIALDAETIRVLRGLDRAQRAAGLSAEYVFLTADGTPLLPNYLTHRFRALVLASGLPPVRLHDLRHGAATLALAARTDLKVVQGTLGHSSIVLTADTYVSVLPVTFQQAADATARLVLTAARKTGRQVRRPAA
jgi:integrase